ncbi:hypothetical protein AVEN_273432-1 [Araneus ventricosus]|uniref:Uncharacterized protein n=1 Tax=Araneus ventricosus TaxID=182803 RepID=A0A4Y2E1N7_ARAVE|nr:hypothetical protein AVEN_273432-1 [Araneus ventricosus]
MRTTLYSRIFRKTPNSTWQIGSTNREKITDYNSNGTSKSAERLEADQLATRQDSKHSEHDPRRSVLPTRNRGCLVADSPFHDRKITDFNLGRVIFLVAHMSQMQMIGSFCKQKITPYHYNGIANKQNSRLPNFSLAAESPAVPRNGEKDREKLCSEGSLSSFGPSETACLLAQVRVVRTYKNSKNEK